MSDSTSIASNEVANEINKDKEYRLNSLIKQQQQSKSIKQQKEAGLPKDLGSRLLLALEYNPLSEKDLFGLKISTRVLNHLSANEVRDLVEVFQTLDIDGKGYMKPTDLYHAMRILNFKTSFAECESYVIDLTGLTCAKGIDINEFLEFIIDNQFASKDHYDELLHCFEMLDCDKCGFLSLESLKKSCIEAKLNLSERELKEMIEIADKNGDELINKTEFMDIMLKTNLYSS